MAFLNTKAVLDRAATKFQDQTANLRSKSLEWLNEVARDIHNQPRQWKFLEEEVVLPITSNQAVLPAGAKIVNLYNDNFFFTLDDQLTDEEANAIGTETSASVVPDGFTLSSDSVITFHPGANGTVNLKYEINLEADLTDSETDTIYPKDLENLFVSGIRMHYYDYDKDGRYTKEVMVYENEMYKVKCWDNRKKAVSKQTNRGYTRVKA